MNGLLERGMGTAFAYRSMLNIFAITSWYLNKLVISNEGSKKYEKTYKDPAESCTAQYHYAKNTVGNGCHGTPAAWNVHFPFHSNLQRSLTLEFVSKIPLAVFKLLFFNLIKIAFEDIVCKFWRNKSEGLVSAYVASKHIFTGTL